MSERERLFDLLIHDLIGPLSVVSATTTGLLGKTDRKGPLTDRQRSGLARILRNVNKAQGILEDMFEILRSEEGLFRKEFFPVETVLKESILDVLEVESHDTAEILRKEAKRKKFWELLAPLGIFVEIAGRYRGSSFCHDPRKVRYILRNLLSNAMRFRRNRVGISVGGDADLFVSVEDDGTGIPLAEQEAVFERFVSRRGPGHPFGTGGIGLGLAGVKALVGAMGGKIALESGEGAGTRFTVTIPPLQ